MHLYLHFVVFRPIVTPMQRYFAKRASIDLSQDARSSSISQWPTPCAARAALTLTPHFKL